MAGVRDPAFWKRFSVAVHMDEENEGQRPEMKHSDSWLGRQNRKRARRTYICCGFWLAFFLFILGVIAVIIWLLKSGILQKIHLNGDSDSSSSSNSTSNSTDVSDNKFRRALLI